MSKPFLIIAGQFPPPVNGFAYITQEIVKVLSVNHEIQIIDIAPHISKNKATYHLRRLYLTVKGTWPLLLGSLKSNRRFYVACEGGIGLIYTIMLALLARTLRYPIYIHHHSFSYIENSSLLMKVLLYLVNQNSIHVFLCPIMGQHFTDRYKLIIQSIIISNSAFVDDVPYAPRTLQKGQPLVIGLLSNLNDAKGLGAFTDLLRVIKSERINIKAILAGPPASANDNRKISAAQKELGDTLNYLGPVYDRDKTEFFRSIDIFVFPTRYANEAQPTVIFEAMACGIPILSYDRGCIKGQVGMCGSVLKRDEGFTPFALNWLTTIMTSPETLRELQHNTKTAFLEDRSEARQSLTRLFDLEPLALSPSHH